MFEIFSLYKRTIEIGLLIVAIAVAAVGVHAFLDHQQDIGYNRAVAEYDKKQVAIDAANAAIVKSLQDQLEKSENAAKIRQDQNAAAAASALAVSNGLLGTINTIRASSTTATVDALRSTTAALATVFADCQGRYGSMAKTADGHASDVKTLMDAWPRQVH